MCFGSTFFSVCPFHDFSFVDFFKQSFFLGQLYFGSLNNPKLHLFVIVFSFKDFFFANDCHFSFFVILFSFIKYNVMLTMKKSKKIAGIVKPVKFSAPF